MKGELKTVEFGVTRPGVWSALHVCNYEYLYCTAVPYFVSKGNKGIYESTQKAEWSCSIVLGGPLKRCMWVLRVLTEWGCCFVACLNAAGAVVPGLWFCLVTFAQVHREFHRVS